MDVRDSLEPGMNRATRAKADKPTRRKMADPNSEVRPGANHGGPGNYVIPDAGRPTRDSRGASQGAPLSNRNWRDPGLIDREEAPPISGAVMHNVDKPGSKANKAREEYRRHLARGGNALSYREAQEAQENAAANRKAKRNHEPVPDRQGTLQFYHPHVPGLPMPEGPRLTDPVSRPNRTPEERAKTDAAMAAHEAEQEEIRRDGLEAFYARRPERLAENARRSKPDKEETDMAKPSEPARQPYSGQADKGRWPTRPGPEGQMPMFPKNAVKGKDRGPGERWSGESEPKDFSQIPGQGELEPQPRPEARPAPNPHGRPEIPIYKPGTPEHDAQMKKAEEAQKFLGDWTQREQARLRTGASGRPQVRSKGRIPDVPELTTEASSGTVGAPPRGPRGNADDAFKQTRKPASRGSSRGPAYPGVNIEDSGEGSSAYHFHYNNAVNQTYNNYGTHVGNANTVGGSPARGGYGGYGRGANPNTGRRETNVYPRTPDAPYGQANLVTGLAYTVLNSKVNGQSLNGALQDTTGHTIEIHDKAGNRLSDVKTDAEKSSRAAHHESQEHYANQYHNEMAAQANPSVASIGGASLQRQPRIRQRPGRRGPMRMHAEGNKWVVDE